MDGKATRVAVVGVGEFGRNHVRVWSKMDGAELVGVVEGALVDAGPGCPVVTPTMSGAVSSNVPSRSNNTAVSAMSGGSLEVCKVVDVGVR